MRINNNPGFPSHLFMRFYHKFEKGFIGLPPKMARWRNRYESGDWSNAFEMNCWIHEGKLAADVNSVYSSQTNSTGWFPIAISNFSYTDTANIGRWVCIEMELVLNTPERKMDFTEYGLMIP